MIALFLACALAEIRVDDLPVENHEVTITLVDDAGRAREGVGVRVIHRPGLRGEEQLSLGVTDSLGRVRWKPEHSGTATIRAADETLDLLVVPTTIPATTLTWLGLCVLACLGALGVGIVRWRRRVRPHRSRH